MLPRSFVTRALPLAAAATLLVGAAACTDDDDPPPSTPTTTRPSTSTTTEAELTDEQQIEQLLEEWFVVSNRIFALDRPIDDARDYLVGTYLEDYLSETQQRIDEGYDTSVSPDSRVIIESIETEADSATATICVRDANQKIDGDTGEVVDDTTSTARFENDLVRTASPERWLIARRTLTEVLEPSSSCESPEEDE